MFEVWYMRRIASVFVATALFLASVAFAAETLDQSAGDLCVMVRTHTPDNGRGVGAATGTGFLVAPDLVLTCNHLTMIPMPQGDLVAASSVRVHAGSDHSVSGQIVSRDSKHDLALIKIKGEIPREALKMSRFAMEAGAPIKIVGNFPDAVRVTQGKLLTDSIMEGFAMGSAKVRSGFSGGPVLDGEGNVQGILSQRDDDNNSIFVRSDVIMQLLSSYEKRSGRKLAAAPAVVEESAVPEKDASVAAADSVPVPKKTRATSRNSVSRKVSNRPARPGSQL